MTTNPEQAAPQPAPRGLSPKQRRARQRVVRASVAVVVFLILWQAVVAVGLVNTLFLPTPVDVARALVKLLTDGELAPHLKASGLEYLLGFGLGGLAGVVLGVMMGWFPFLDDVADPFVAAFYSTPYITFLPIIILWLGIGLWSKVLIIFWASFFPVLINTIAGVKNAPPEYVRVARSYCVGRTATLTTVVVPAAVPYILAGLRQGIGRGLVGVIVAEFYIANKGIGFFISSTTAAFRTADAFAAILITAIVGVVLVRVVAALEQRVARWRGMSQTA